MPPNMWRADHGFCRVPTTPIFVNPVPMVTPPCGPPMLAPQYIPCCLQKKAKKAKKTEVAYVHPIPAPVHYIPTLPPPPPPPQPLYPVAAPPVIVAPGQSKCSKKGGDGYYRRISYTGVHIPLHILKRGTRADCITAGCGHHFRVPGVGFAQRSYPDNLSFEQFVTDFAGKGKWIVTQVREVGEGRWEKGISVDVGTDKGKKTMAEVGWRNDRSPVWVVVEKKE